MASHFTDPRTEALTGSEPGVRMLAGKPYIFDGGALGDHHARVALDRLPSRLSGLSDADLKALEKYAHRAWTIRAAGADQAHRAVWAELEARGFRSDGTRVEQAQQVAA